MKKVSLIVPCYNVEYYIEDCIASIEKQTIGIDALEIIMVNDASTDSTLEHIMKFEQKYPESVIVINLEENVMQGGARNIALSYATGEYIAFLDSDDWVDSGFYQSLYETAKKYDAEIVQFPFRNVTLNEEGTIIKETITQHARHMGFYMIENDEKRKKFLNERIINCGSQSKFYNGDFLRRENPRFLQKVAYEEPSFVYPLLFSVNRVYCIDLPGYYYRMRNGSTMQDYVRKPGKLYDHPYVQLSILEEMKQKTEIYSRFKQEIDFYFVFTFWVETIWFAKTGNLFLGFDYFQVMQETLEKVLPMWSSNAIIQLKENEDIRQIIEEGLSIDCHEELEEYINKINL